MVTDDPEHRLPVLLKARERSHNPRHLGRCCVGVPGEDGGHCAGDGPALIGVISDALTHQQRPEVGVAKPKSPIVVGALCNFL